MRTHKSIKFGFTAAIILSALLAAPAVSDAADARGPAPRVPPVPFYNWSGFYVGAHAGGGFADNDSGFLGGGQIGYNWQLNNRWVVGIEGDIAGTTIKDSADASVGGPGGFATAHAEASLDWVSTLAPRVGYTFDRWLVYGKFGGAWAHASADFNANVVGPGVRAGMTGSFDKTVSGWVLGFGAEYALQGNWTAKFEYNMMDFGSDSPFVDDKFHVFKAGINYRFGGPWGF